MIDTENTPKVRRFARLYAKRGIRVFPVDPNGKGPCHRLLGSWKEEATTDQDQIEEWFCSSPTPNLGVATGEWDGPGTLFVVDIDVPGGYETWEGLRDDQDEEIPETAAAETPSGGSHLYFRAPPGVTIKSAKDTLGESVDTKGHGGYVVAPPSQTPDGAYRFREDAEGFAKAPFWLLSAASKDGPNSNGRRPNAPSTGYEGDLDVEVVEDALSTIPPQPDYEKWYRIIAAVKDAVGGSIPVAERLLESWSPENQHGKHTYEGRLKSAADDNITAGTLIFYAKEQGWTPPWEDTGPVRSNGQGDVKDEIGETEDEPELQYEPFPMDALPNPVRAYVRASTRALGEEVPPAMVAVPTLSVLSGAIGDAARLELKRSWTEPATLWTVLVAPSGSTKSPAFSHSVRPVFRRESEARDEHEKALAEWKSQDDPDPQERPTRKRFRTGDATPEAVVKILEENPRGVLLARDELGAWIGSFDRYVNGAADLQFWVEVWQGFQASRDRAGEGNTTVDTPAVPVTGTIQPGTLKEKLGEIHFDTGFAARLILCQPPTVSKRWTEADVSRDVRDSYERVLTRLYGTPRGSTVALSPEAKRLWVDFYNRANADLETRPEGPAKAVAAKGITHTARLALVLHLCRKASRETDSNMVVDTESMEAALQVGRWLTEETLRVYRMHNLGAKAKPPIRRFLDRLPDTFETSDAKDIAEEDEIPESTMQNWFNRLQESGDLEKIKHGLYRKT